MKVRLERPSINRFALPILVALLVSTLGIRAADTLPARIADDAFWKLIEDSSEPGGAFQSENFSSNETGFQTVIPQLQRLTKPEGVYMGVGPEQNFTYIVALRPKIAFIVDIRRQNMLEHMIYRAAFEMSENRADFLSRMFSRKRPAGLSETSTVDELFRAYTAAAVDTDAYKKNLQDIRDLLVKQHKFGLTPEDLTNIEHVYMVFRDFGPELNYSSGAGRTPNPGGRGGGRGMPNYSDLMTAADGQGMQRGFLASEENYKWLRDFERRNLLVPMSGDFGGPKAIKAVGQYLKDHGATVTAFYLSNVESYLFQGTGGRGNLNGGATNFYNNVASLPLDASSVFIRSGNGGGRVTVVAAGAGNAAAPGGMNVSSVASITETLAAVKDGRIQAYNDVFTLSK